MTQLRKKKCPRCGEELDPISNYFDALFKGIGHRGSSFMDLDRVDYHAVQDDATGRLLIFEFKGPHEKTNVGQWRTLKGTIGISPKIEAWALRLRSDGRIDFFDIRRSTAIEIIEPAECQRRYSAWWNQRPLSVAQPTPPCKHKPEFKDNGHCRICAAMRRTA